MTDALPDSFADAPVSIDEIRSDKSRNAADISARSTLIMLLRDLDRGEIDPEHLVVIWEGKIEADGHHKSGWRAAGPSNSIHVGMLQKAMHRMIRLVDDD